ncbi:MAG: hypothetical protein AAGE65_00375 [Planctomycetota bacterium]
MDVSVGHLGFRPYLPGENLAVDVARAERLAPATEPRDQQPRALFKHGTYELHEYHRLHDPAVLAALKHATPPCENHACTAERPAGFLRLETTAHLHDHPHPAADPIVIERPVPIYPPATLGVLLDVFA